MSNVRIKVSMLILPVIASMVLVGCDRSKPADSPEMPVEKDVSVQEPVEPAEAIEPANPEDFAFNLYAKISGGEGNLFYSPMSISTALAMTYTGARGTTADQMAGVFGFDAIDGRPEQVKAFAEKYAAVLAKVQESATDANKLNIANSLWAQKDFAFDADFIDVNRNAFNAMVKNVDFVAEKKAAVDAINQWVSDATNKTIPQLLGSGDVDQMTRLILANAVYFKGTWKTEFDEKLTSKADFFTDAENSVAADMMNAKLRAGMYDDPKFAILEMPYQGDNLVMTIILPKERAGLGDIEKGLTRENLDIWLGKLRPMLVDVRLPKFKFTKMLSLGQILAAMGMPAAFDQVAADFSGMTGKKDLYISKVVHKAFVAVDEKGTEAAGATAVIMPTRSMRPRTVQFHADHPFVFMIRDKVTNAVLFMGRVCDPTAQ